uniref:Probable protein-export membrane protein SecG n=1 Tax=Yamadaella caenomyce TaxID=259029 RepID=A0A1G4NYQ9_9FLOR|nr:hypothetical protein P8462_pgp090 [Yamadaella caenomyce]SCW23820.1 secG [Yamadaella caenomyce]
MKFVWYIVSTVLIVLILSNNPKSDGFGMLSSRNQVFDTTNQATTFVESLTWICIILFLSLTTMIALSY